MENMHNCCYLGFCGFGWMVCTLEIRTIELGVHLIKTVSIKNWQIIQYASIAKEYMKN